MKHHLAVFTVTGFITELLQQPPENRLLVRHGHYARTSIARNRQVLRQRRQQLIVRRPWPSDLSFGFPYPGGIFILAVASA